MLLLMPLYSRKVDENLPCFLVFRGNFRLFWHLELSTCDVIMHFIIIKFFNEFFLLV